MSARDPIEPVLAPAAVTVAETLPAVTVAELLAIVDDGRVPLVRFAGQVTQDPVRARTTIDLHGAHVGGSVLLVFEDGLRTQPIVIGLLRHPAGWPLDPQPARVHLEADGARMVVEARDQLVLRCGKASVTLTRAGKVLIQGSYVSTQSTGVTRVKGASVQIN
jgi:hypothetical protein